MDEGLAELQDACRVHMERGKFLVTLGGEHSLSQAPVKAAREAFGEIGVVQFDAHTDLREEFEGTPYSHASVMKRIVDEGIPTLAVGIRSLSAPEASLVREKQPAGDLGPPARPRGRAVPGRCWRRCRRRST